MVDVHRADALTLSAVLALGLRGLDETHRDHGSSTKLLWTECFSPNVLVFLGNRARQIDHRQQDEDVRLQQRYSDM